MKAKRFIVLFNFVIILLGFTSINFYSQIIKKSDSENKKKTSADIKPLTAQDSNNTDPVSIRNKYADRNNDRYRIGFKDILDIKVYRHPELNQTVSVNPDGTIDLYRIDNPVVAVCKTEKELADLVASLYQNFLRRPFINVRAIEQKSQPMAVLGAVKKPGVFYLNNRVRLIQLLSLAEGHDVELAGSKIRIARIGNESGCEENTNESPEVGFLSFDLFEVLKGKQNPWVQPGDIVSVLEAEEAYVVGNVVNEAEKISLKEPYVARWPAPKSYDVRRSKSARAASARRRTRGDCSFRTSSRR